MHDGAWLWIYVGSGGETRLEMCGAEAILWKILNHTRSYGKNLDRHFPKVDSGSNNLHGITNNSL